MGSIIFIAVFMLVAYGGVFYFMNLKKQKQKAMFQNTDFNSEMNKAEQYKKEYLNNELSFLVKQMNNKPIDAFNYANINYTTKDSIKDGLKDGLKGLATLGTVKFNTVQTPKYLILSGADLHLFDTDTEGDISNHLVFDAFRLEQSMLTEIPLEGTIKAYAQQKGDATKAYRISLATDGKPIELILFSALIFTYATNTGVSMFSLNETKTLKEIVIGSDFLKKIGEKYPNLKA